MIALIVDDSAAERVKMVGILEEFKCQIHCASNGADAVNLALEKRPDIIFMDIVMPLLDGIAAARELARHTQTRMTPIVFVSSKNSQREKLWATMLGAQNFLTKPVNRQNIAAELEGLKSLQSLRGNSQ